MIKILAALILIYTFVVSGIFFTFYGKISSISVVLGGLTVFFNVLGLALFWHLIFSKKSIALAVLVIIFKYLLLAIVLWSLWTIKIIDLSAFCMGLSSLLFGCLALPVVKSRGQKNN